MGRAFDRCYEFSNLDKNSDFSVVLAPVTKNLVFHPSHGCVAPSNISFRDWFGGGEGEGLRGKKEGWFWRNPTAVHDFFESTHDYLEVRLSRS